MAERALIAALLLSVIILLVVCISQRRQLKFFTLVAHRMCDLLTGSKWHGEMLLEPNPRKKKIADLENTHNVAEGINSTIKLLNAFLHRTSKTRSRAMDAKAKHTLETILQEEK